LGTTILIGCFFFLQQHKIKKAKIKQSARRIMTIKITVVLVPLEVELDIPLTASEPAGASVLGELLEVGKPVGLLKLGCGKKKTVGETKLGKVEFEEDEGLAGAAGFRGEAGEVGAT
jgi:hypothetical protein